LVAGDLGTKVEEHLEKAIDRDLKGAEQLSGKDEEITLADKLVTDLRLDGDSIDVEPAVSKMWKEGV
jgi:hypothetical protein